MKLKRVFGWIALAIPLAVTMAIVVGYWLSDNDCGKAAPPGARGGGHYRVAGWRKS
jgi:hypothetical protein